MSSERTGEIRELRLRVPQAELDALYRRLREFRNQDDHVATGLDRVVPAAYVDELLGYWTSGYDWRTHERRLNTYDHFGTEIAGQFVHFLHVRSAVTDATPVLLSHAWPSTVLDVLDTTGPLESEGRFHLVIPSITWSALAGPGAAGDSPSRRTAAGWAELMGRLGYDSYQVGDDRSGLDSTPAYTVVSEPEAAQGEPQRGLDSQELAEVRWFNENLTASNERQQLSSLVTSTALLSWNAQLVNPDVDRDTLLTGVTLAWFAARLAVLPVKR